MPTRPDKKIVCAGDYLGTLNQELRLNSGPGAGSRVISGQVSFGWHSVGLLILPKGAAKDSTRKCITIVETYPLMKFANKLSRKSMVVSITCQYNNNSRALYPKSPRWHKLSSLTDRSTCRTVTEVLLRQQAGREQELTSLCCIRKRTVSRTPLEMRLEVKPRKILHRVAARKAGSRSSGSQSSTIGS
jgi:hypothetical protein